MKKINNKGFTLVELVVAIAVLAIIITPILQSFVTSARLNLKSRKLMIATDVNQSLTEGISDKTYTEVLSICKKNMGNSMSGEKIFSTINDGAFNLNEAYVASDAVFGSANAADPKNIQPDEISWGGFLNKKTVDIYNKESETYNCYKVMSLSIKQCWSIACGNPALIPAKTPKISYWTDSNSKVLFICYANIDNNGFIYDAIMSFIPAADKKTDVYYPYYVEISLYEVDKKTGNHNFETPVMTYTTGIKSIYQKGNVEK